MKSFEKNITVFIPNLEYGGAEIVSINAANYFALKHKVTLLVLNDSGPLKSRVSDAVLLFSLDNSRSRYSILKLYRYLIFNRIDIFMTNLREVNILSALVFFMPFIKANLFIREAGFLLRDTTSKKLKVCLIRILYRKKYNYIFNSRGTLGSFRECGIQVKNAIIIGNPVLKEVSPLEDIILDTKRKDYSKGSVFKILAVGRLHPVKDYMTLLKALRLVLSTHRNVKLYIVGDGPDKLNLEAFVRENRMINNVVFVGFVNELKDYYNMADLFVSTSITEGFGNVIVEALSHGLYVFASNSKGGVLDILNDTNGKLFHVGDFVTLKNYVIDFIESKIDYSPENQVLSSRRFTIESIGDEYEAFFTKQLS